MGNKFEIGDGCKTCGKKSFDDGRLMCRDCIKDFGVVILRPYPKPKAKIGDVVVICGKCQVKIGGANYDNEYGKWGYSYNSQKSHLADLDILENLTTGETFFNNTND